MMLSGKRDLAAALIVRAGLVRPLAAAYSSSLHRLRVLAYHRVLPRSTEPGFDYDIELVSAWEDEFDWQMRYLARNHEVITCQELAQLIDAGRPVPRRAVIVTFDDGYQDNHDVVLPILRRHGVPAVVFVATGYMDSRETYWYDQLVHWMLRVERAELDLPGGGTRLHVGGDQAARRRTAQAALKHLKVLPEGLRRETIDAWRRALGAPACDEFSGNNGPMSWGQVKALADAGIEIGSHSVTHPVLANVADDEQLERELVDSKAQIEARTGQQVVSLAYPVGGPGAYSERVVEFVRRAGYRFGFTYESGVIDLHRMDPFRLRRLAVERYISRERFQATLAMPPLFS